MLREARAELAGRLGLDPGPGLRDLETAILRQDDALAASGRRGGPRVGERHRRPRPRRAGAGPRLEAAVGLMRGLAVTGEDGLPAAREHRAAAVEAAEELGDPDLTARVIGAYDVPANWARSDDPAQAARVVAAALRTLDRLPPGTPPGTRARLLATVALESRGDGSPARRGGGGGGADRPRAGGPGPAGVRAERAYMQSFGHTGLSGRRAPSSARRSSICRYATAWPATRSSATSSGLQSACAVADFGVADGHAARLDDPRRTPRPAADDRLHDLVPALRLAEDPAVAFAAKQAAYLAAVATPGRGGDAGPERGGLPELASLCLRLRHGRPPGTGYPGSLRPYEPWVRPVLRPDADLARGARPAPRPAGRGHVGAAGAGRPAAGRPGRAAPGAGRRWLPRRGNWPGRRAGCLSLGPVGRLVG